MSDLPIDGPKFPGQKQQNTEATNSRHLLLVLKVVLHWMEKRLVSAVVKALGEARCLCVADEWKIYPFSIFVNLL
jgi:hypothetical protein